MVRLSVKHLLEVGNRGIFVFRVLLESFAETKVSIDRLFINLDCMLEVFGCALALSQVCQEVGQMNASAKVIVVHSEALFEVLHAFLEVFHLFVAHSDIVERVRFRWTLIRVLCLNFNRKFKCIDCVLPLTKFVINFAL